MSHHNVLSKQSKICRMLLGLALAFSALGAEGQIPPIPLPVPNTTVFSPPQNISSNPGASFGQQIAVDPSGNIYVVWLDSSPGYPAIFFAQSSDAGITFSTPLNLSNDPGGSTPPRMAVDLNSDINVVWAGTSGSKSGVLSRSIDGGVTFPASATIANNLQRTAIIALDSSGNIYVAWVDSISFNVFFSKSMDGGATFSISTQVTNRPPINGAFVSAIAVDGAGNIDLVWQDCDSFCHMWFDRSSDGGATFSLPISIAGTLEFSPLVGTALDSAGNIYVVYNTVPSGDIWLVRSIDGGTTFSGTNISNDNSVPHPAPRAQPCCAQIAIDSADNIDVVWQDDGPLRDITFARSTDGGASFSIAPVSTTGFNPRIAVGSVGDINVVWTGNYPNSDVFYSSSSDNGVTFSNPQNLSNNNRSPGAPQLDPGPLLALDSCGNVNVVWTDDAPGNLDIFFSRGVTTNSILNGCLVLPRASSGKLPGTISEPGVRERRFQKLQHEKRYQDSAISAPVSQ
jgi:hypothetical protein